MAGTDDVIGDNFSESEIIKALVLISKLSANKDLRCVVTPSL